MLKIKKSTVHKKGTMHEQDQTNFYQLGWQHAGWTIAIWIIVIASLFIFIGKCSAQGITVNRKHYFDNLGGSGGDGWVQVLYDTSFTESGFYVNSPWWSNTVTYDAANDEIDFDGLGSDFLYQDSVYILTYGQTPWYILNGDSVKLQVGVRNAVGNFYMGAWIYDYPKTFGTRQQIHGLSTRNNGIYTTTILVSGTAWYSTLAIQFYESAPDTNTASAYFIKMWKKEN